jgi:predicted O-methyltransferase YrrM
VNRLLTEPVRAALASIEAQGRALDPAAKARVRAAQHDAGRDPLPLAERDRLYAGAPLSVTPEVGRLLYALVRAKRPAAAFEFGTSVGYSTIHLAAALADAGGAGRLITTEKDPDKARLAREHLAAAGLDDRVAVHAGDALGTIATLPTGIDFAFLDGWNDLYLDVLRALEPRLAPATVVVADYSADDPLLAPFITYIFDPGTGWAATELPVGDGVAVATWDGA